MPKKKKILLTVFDCSTLNQPTKIQETSYHSKSSSFYFATARSNGALMIALHPNYYDQKQGNIITRADGLHLIDTDEEKLIGDFSPNFLTSQNQDR